MTERTVPPSLGPIVIVADPVSVPPGTIGPTPPGAFLVYGPDPRCEGYGNVIPDLVLCTAMRDRAAEYLVREVSAGRIHPGPKFTSCTYPSDPAWPSCISYTVHNALPEIRFGVSPVWVEGSIGGVPHNGPAAGVAYEHYIRVMLCDPDPRRVYLLCAWECSNSLLAYLFDLYTEADGPITSAACAYAAAECGV